MSAIAALRDGYPGYAAWKRFVNVFRLEWEQRGDRDLYREMFGDEDLAIVATASLSAHTAEWFNMPIGALDMRTVADVLKNEPSGIIIVRSLLMRLPR
jgi:hypothetical protein